MLYFHFILFEMLRVIARTAGHGAAVSISITGHVTVLGAPPRLVPLRADTPLYDEITLTTISSGENSNLQSYINMIIYLHY